MTYFLQQLINGLAIGATYGLVAIGFTLVYGVVGILNVAQADLATLASYVALYLATTLGLGAGGAVLGVIAASIVAGVILYYAVFSRLRPENVLAMFVATIGVSFAIEYGIARVAGSAPRLFPSLLPDGGITVQGVSITYANLTVFGVSLALTLALWVLVSQTRVGREMRAVAAAPAVAPAVGINIPRIRLLSVVISTLLAGIAGLLLSALYTSVNPFLGQVLAFNMFVIAIVGGVGSVAGTFAISLIIGVIPAVTSTYLSANATALLPLGAMVIVLLVRPEGLVGGSQVRRG